MQWNPDLPHNSLPLLPPAKEIETKQVLRATTEARAALATLNQVVRFIPEPVILLNALPLIEAQASSEIENILTTRDDLFQHFENETLSSSPELKETFRYRRAVFSAIDYLETRPLSFSVAQHVCSEIKNRQMDIRTLPGTFIGNAITGAAVYTPPQGRDVLHTLISNWEEFLHSTTELDPLIAMAVMHYQFEAIHPFSDGNGRTGRVLNILFLLEKRLLTLPILYLSRFIITHKEEYYSRLLAVTQNAAWEEWILFMLNAVRETCERTTELVEEILSLYSTYMALFREVPGVRNDPYLVNVLFAKPFCRISDVVEKCGVTRLTATKWLEALQQAGILEDKKVGRDRIFINRRFYDILREI